MGYHFCLSQLTNVNRFSKGETTETATELAWFVVSDRALIAAQAHTRGLYLVQRANREQRLFICEHRYNVMFKTL